MSNEDRTGKGFLDELESLSNDAEKKPKKASSVDEVENLLKTTLSEVGINAEKLRASVKTMEAEKKKEQEEMSKLDELLEPIHKPVHETAHDFLRSTVHDKIQEPVEEPPVKSFREEMAHEAVRETYHEPVTEPILESFHEPVKDKAPFVPKPQDRAEIFEKPKPTAKDIFPPLPEKKPAARPAPPIHRERLETPAKKPDVIFDAYADKPKKKFPVAIAAVAAVVVVGGIAAVIFMGKSGKTAVPEAKPAALQADATPAETPDATLTQNTAESGTVEPQSTPGAKPAVPEPSAKKTAAQPAVKQPVPSVSTQTGPASESTGAPSEPISPIVPVTTPRVQEVKPAPNPAAGGTSAQPGTTPPAATEQPKKAKLGDLIPLEQVDTQPVVQQKFEATYPPLGRRMGIEGTVIVNALISETGTVIRTNVLRKIQGGTNYGFETASEDSVKKWRFKPAVKDGVNVKTWLPVAVVFRK